MNNDKYWWAVAIRRKFKLLSQESNQQWNQDHSGAKQRNVKPFDTKNFSSVCPWASLMFQGGKSPCGSLCEIWATSYLKKIRNKVIMCTETNTHSVSRHTQKCKQVNYLPVLHSAPSHLKAALNLHLVNANISSQCYCRYLLFVISVNRNAF